MCVNLVAGKAASKASLKVLLHLMCVNLVAGKAASKASLKVLLHLMCVTLGAGKAASKASLKGTAKGVELDVKPSAPTSMPLRVRFGTGSPTGTVVNPMFAQDGTASRYTPPPLLPGCVCLRIFFWSLVAIASLLGSVTELPACLSNNPLFAEHATAVNL